MQSEEVRRAVPRSQELVGYIAFGIALWMALNVSVALLRRFRANTNIPPGVFLVVDTTLQGKEILVPTDFGERVILTYITSDDPSLAGVSLIGRA